MSQQQKKIQEGIAQNAYIWDSFRKGKNTIEPFDKLTEEQRKPYYVFAHQLSIYLDREGLVIKVEGKLPFIRYNSTGWITPSQADVIENAYRKAYAGCVFVEPLIDKV